MLCTDTTISPALSSFRTRLASAPRAIPRWSNARGARHRPGKSPAPAPTDASRPGVIVGRDERWGRTMNRMANSPIWSAAWVQVRSAISKPPTSPPPRQFWPAQNISSVTAAPRGKDQGDTACDEATLRRLFLAPYVDAVRAGVGSIMISYSSWNGAKMHGQRGLITDVLKANSASAVHHFRLGRDRPAARNYSAQIETSINAGLDMIMIPNGPGKKNNYNDFATLLGEHVRAGRVSEARINDAVLRISGLNWRCTSRIGRFRTEHSSRAGFARSAARRRSRVCAGVARAAQNEHKALPLAKSIHHLHVVGAAADDLGAQCGGWTISWQAHPWGRDAGRHHAACRPAPSGTADCTITFDADATNLTAPMLLLPSSAKTRTPRGQG